MTLIEDTNLLKTVRCSGHGSRFWSGIGLTDDRNRPIKSGYTDGRGAYYCNDCSAMIRSMSPSQLPKSALGETK